MQRLEVSGAVRPTYGSLGVKRLNIIHINIMFPKVNIPNQFFLKVLFFYAC